MAEASSSQKSATAAGAKTRSSSPGFKNSDGANADGAKTDDNGSKTRARATSSGWRLPSIINTIQKYQQPYEIEPANTKPIVFFLLAIPQLPICIGVSRWLAVPGLIYIPMTTIGMHIAGCIISEVIGSAFMFDLTGEVAFACAMALSLSQIEGSASSRQILCSVAFFVWDIRLGWFLFHRILKRGHDWRFDKCITEKCYNLFCWVCQGTWVWLQGMCLWALNASSPKFANAPFSWTDYVGLLVWTIGLAIEVLADHQKSTWNRSIPSNQQKTWINHGLWRYSRHPNFFGEMLLWFGMSLATCGGLGDRWKLAFVSGVWSVYFLMFTSLMLLEKRLDAKFGGQEAYEQYKLDTSILIPWPNPSKSASEKTD